MSTDVPLPRLGSTTMEGATILQWLVAVGDHVDADQPLAEVETDKSVIEIPSPLAGVVAELVAREGDTVPVGEVMARIGAPDADAGRAATAGGWTDPADPADPTDPTDPTDPAGPPGLDRPAALDRVRASPAARRRARELGVDLASIAGSGPDGRVDLEDVEAAGSASPARGGLAASGAPGSPASWGASAKGAPASPTSGGASANGASASPTSGGASANGASASPAGVSDGARALDGSSGVPASSGLSGLSGVRRLTAERMATSSREVAAVTLTRQIDATALAELATRLRSAGLAPAPGVTDLVVAAVARALAGHAALNVSLSPEGMVHHTDVNVGWAVHTERGLLVPVLPAADRLSVGEVALRRRELTERARSGRLRPEEMTGGRVSVSNLGMHGVDVFTPIVNLPECMILGVGRLADAVLAHRGRVAVRTGCWLSLTFDHRLVDGAPAARLLADVSAALEEPLELVLGDSSSGGM